MLAKAPTLTNPSTPVGVTILQCWTLGDENTKMIHLLWHDKQSNVFLRNESQQGIASFHPLQTDCHSLSKHMCFLFVSFRC